jgi:hypothetical protein
MRSKCCCCCSCCRAMDEHFWVFDLWKLSKLKRRLKDNVICLD